MIIQENQLAMAQISLERPSIVSTSKHENMTMAMS